MIIYKHLESLKEIKMTVSDDSGCTRHIFESVNQKIVQTFDEHITDRHTGFEVVSNKK